MIALCRIWLYNRENGWLDVFVARLGLARLGSRLGTARPSSARLVLTCLYDMLCYHSITTVIQQNARPCCKNCHNYHITYHNLLWWERTCSPLFPMVHPSSHGEGFVFPYGSPQLAWEGLVSTDLVLVVIPSVFSFFSIELNSEKHTWTVNKYWDLLHFLTSLKNETHVFGVLFFICMVKRYLFTIQKTPSLCVHMARSVPFHHASGDIPEYPHGFSEGEGNVCYRPKGSFWFLRNPLNQLLVALCRRTRKIQLKLTREGLLTSVAGQCLEDPIYARLGSTRLGSALGSARLGLSRLGLLGVMFSLVGGWCSCWVACTLFSQ